MSAERLQKVLASAGIASRRDCEDLINAGRVSVNGKVVTVPGTRVDAEQDEITVDNQPIGKINPRTYVMLHKPTGVVSTADDPQGRPTVVELVDLPARLFPVGRLDYDSEGLLLMTDDGELTQRLTHPSYQIEKEYRALLDQVPTADALREWRNGVPLDDAPTAPAWVDVLERGENGVWVRVVLHEGRKRQIREVAKVLGYEVLRLIRVREGPILLGELPAGEWRPLTDQEVESLWSHIGGREAEIPETDRAAVEAVGSGRGRRRIAPAADGATERPARRAPRADASDKPDSDAAPRRARTPRSIEDQPSAPGLDQETFDRPPRREEAPRRDDRASFNARGPRRDDSSRGGFDSRGPRPDDGPRGGFDSRGPRREEAPRRDDRGGFDSRGPRRDFDARGPRRDDRPREGYDSRGPRPDNRGSFDNRGPRRDDRPREGYDSRGPRPDNRGSFDNRGPRRDDRPRGFDNRGPRPDNRGGFDSRGPRRDDRPREGYDNRGPRPDNRGSFDNRGPRRDDRPRGYDNRGPRPDNRGSFDNRGPRGGFDARGPRRDDSSRGYDSRGPRRDDSSRGYDSRGPRPEQPSQRPNTDDSANRIDRPDRGNERPAPRDMREEKRSPGREWQERASQERRNANQRTAPRGGRAFRFGERSGTPRRTGFPFRPRPSREDENKD